MSEVVALNDGWAKFKQASGVASTVYWDEGFQRWTYPTKIVFDHGWAAAMRYVEEQAKKGEGRS